MKKPELHRLRENSAYPAFRGVVEVAAVFGYVAAGIVAIVFIQIAMNTQQPLYFLAGFVASLCVAVLALAGREFSLMLADIADASVENLKNAPGQEIDRERAPAKLEQASARELEEASEDAQGRMP